MMKFFLLSAMLLSACVPMVTASPTMTLTKSPTVTPASTETFVPNPIDTLTPVPTFDQETILFRDTALQIIQGFDTIKYSVSIDFSRPPEKWVGNLQATQNAFHTIIYDENGNKEEEIQVGKDYCNGYTPSTPSWKCITNAPWTPFHGIENILEGKSSFDSYKQVTEYGSRLDSYKDLQCRCFFVEGRYKVEEWEGILYDEICFDLHNHLPIYWLSRFINKSNDVVIGDDKHEAFGFEFNVPVEIALPKP